MTKLELHRRWHRKIKPHRNLTMRPLFLILILSALPHFLLINKANGQLGNQYSQAERLFFKEQFKEALNEFYSASKGETVTPVAEYQMEVCSLLTEYRNKPLDRFLELGESVGRSDKFYYYWLGRVHFRRYEFRQSINAWKKFLSLNVYKSPDIVAETKIYIKWAEDADAVHQNPAAFHVTQVSYGPNSFDSEFSPVFLKDKRQLVFVSKGLKTIEDKNFYVYTSDLTADGWSTPVTISQLGSLNPNVPHLEYDLSSHEFYFFRGEFDTELYSAKYNDGTWDIPVEFEGKAPMRRLEGHFFINEDQTLFLFAEKKKSGSADFDLYISKKDFDDKWSKPEIISQNLVSDEDENYPYLTSDGKTLYFSSRGFGSMGGFDIFRSDLDEKSGNWSDPRPLGYPINTIDDDLQYRLDKGEDESYFISDRFGTMGGYDIYSVGPVRQVEMFAQVFDQYNVPCDKLDVQIFVDSARIINTHTDKEGKFTALLREDQLFSVVFSHQGKKLPEQEFMSPSTDRDGLTFERSFVVYSITDDVEQTQDSVLHEELAQEEPAYEELGRIASKFRRNSKARIDIIYFEFDQYYLKWEDRPILDPLVRTLKENPEVKIEIAGHTDNIGSKEQNARISQLRANSIVAHLIDQGISKERLTAKGYGETKPLVSNDDEKEGREINRRIEVVVIE